MFKCLKRGSGYDPLEQGWSGVEPIEPPGVGRGVVRRSRGASKRPGCVEREIEGQLNFLFPLCRHVLPEQRK